MHIGFWGDPGRYDIGTESVCGSIYLCLYRHTYVLPLCVHSTQVDVASLRDVPCRR
jgi:hypothetical protein